MTKSIDTADNENESRCVISRDRFPWLSPYILSEDSYLRPYVVDIPLKLLRG
jgi:hypothetical protein